MNRIITILSILLIVLLLPFAALAEVVQLPIDTTGGLPYQGEYEEGVTVYEDPSIRVEVFSLAREDNRFDTACYYAKIKIANGTQIRASSPKGFDRSVCIPALTLAKRVNAVIAINGDYYIGHSKPYVLRQGVVYKDTVRENMDILLVDEDGDFHVLLAADDPKSIDKTTINGKKVYNAFSFGPALIVDNEVVYVKKSCPGYTEPNRALERMCIVQTGPLEYMVVCVQRKGCTVPDMIELVQEIAGDVKVAYLLDGGQSSQMVFLDHLVNQGNRQSRDISDIIYFASAYQPEE